MEPLRGLAAADVAAALAELTPAPGPAAEEVDLRAAVGRVCARAVLAPADLPPSPTARVDGYACPHPRIGQRLKVAHRAAPGDDVPPSLAEGEACLVMTGAPLPPGVAAVVPREHARETGDEVAFERLEPVPAVPPGARAARGDTLAEAGARLGPDAVGRLADFGIAVVAVTVRPEVDLLAVGSELADPAAAPPSPGARPPHYNSNAYVLAALAEGCGARPRLLPPAPDDPAAVAEILAASAGPLLVTTGGTARGVHDHTRAALWSAGFSVVLEGLGVRPGHTLRVAVQGRRTVVSLPGSGGAMGPLFALVVGPLLRRLAGETAWAPRWRHARLAEAVPRHRPMDTLAPVRLSLDEGVLKARPVSRDPDAYALLPEGQTPLAAGTTLSVLWEGGPD